MPKRSVKQREVKRTKAYENHQLKRSYLLQARRRVTNYSQYVEILTGLNSIGRDSSLTRKSNRCSVTHTARAYNRLTGLSRHQLRELGHQAMLPGLFKASW